MKFLQSHALKDIASIIGCEFIGDPLFEVLGMNEIHVVSAGDIVFVDHPKYYDKALNSKATVILINKTVPCPKGKALLISDEEGKETKAGRCLSKGWYSRHPSTKSKAARNLITGHRLLCPVYG